MIDKIAASIAQALASVKDGATVLIGGFGTSGIPGELIDGLIEQGAKDLTVVNNIGLLRCLFVRMGGQFTDGSNGS
jgi:3-oxoadipate CoA-transferase alpha subunit